MKATILFALLAAPGAVLGAAGSVEIKTIPMSGSVHMLTGQGGNIGVSAGEDGVFLIDDQFAPLTGKIRAAVRALGPGEIRFLVNTHWHGDHTGGNENLGKAGTVIVAHENVRRRMRSGGSILAIGREVSPAPKAALPVLTYPRAVTFHLNGDEVRVFHVPRAHTDGDSMILFKKADVLHMGDVFFNGFYPFIDVDSGGSLDGMIAGVRKALSIVDASTKIIPGHGKPARLTDLRRYLAMLRTVRKLMSKAVSDGKSLESVLEEDPLKDLHGTWGGGFMKPETFTRIVYRDLRRSSVRARVRAGDEVVHADVEAVGLAARLVGEAAVLVGAQVEARTPIVEARNLADRVRVALGVLQDPQVRVRGDGTRDVPGPVPHLGPLVVHQGPVLFSSLELLGRVVEDLKPRVGEHVGVLPGLLRRIVVGVLLLPKGLGNQDVRVPHVREEHSVDDVELEGALDVPGHGADKVVGYWDRASPALVERKLQPAGLRVPVGPVRQALGRDV